MAKRISELRTVNKSANTSREYVLLSNIDSNSSTKLALNDIFPTLQSGKVTGSVTEGTAGTTVQDIFVGGGAGSAVGGTDKSVLIFKGLNVEDTNGALKIRTDVSTADSNKKNIVIELTQSSIDLNVASNSNAKFLSETGGKNTLNLGTSSHYTGTLPVNAGGTGTTTLTDGSLLVGNGTGAVNNVGTMAKGAIVVGTSAGTNPAVVTVGANNTVLVADSTQANGVKWDKPVVTSIDANVDIQLNANNIEMQGGWINGSDTDNRGIYLNTTNDHVYIGDGTTYSTSALNVEGNISVGNSTGNSAQTISMKSCTSGASPALTLAGCDNADDTHGGNVTLRAGAGETNGNGGRVTIAGGLKSGTGTAGTVEIKTNDTASVTVDQNNDVTLNNGSLIVLGATDGLVHSGRGSVTQTTGLNNGVTINATSGIITLFGAALNAAAETDFLVTNSTVQADSLILLTVQCPASASAVDGATMVAQLDTVSAGSFNIRLSNPGGSNTSTNAHKIHFLVINNS